MEEIKVRNILTEHHNPHAYGVSGLAISVIVSSIVGSAFILYVLREKYGLFLTFGMP